MLALAVPLIGGAEVSQSIPLFFQFLLWVGKLLLSLVFYVVLFYVMSHLMLETPDLETILHAAVLLLVGGELLSLALLGIGLLVPAPPVLMGILAILGKIGLLLYIGQRLFLISGYETVHWIAAFIVAEMAVAFVFQAARSLLLSLFRVVS